MKKIIFVGGTARSGSTLLDLIIANDPKAMSLGEIHALFRPTRKHHFEKLEKLKKDKIWANIIKDGKQNLYFNLIKHFPQFDIFVDSSKDPFWFKYQEKTNNTIAVIKHVLIYKSPEELAKSFIKRGKNFKWIRAYKRYHKKYFALIDASAIISYKELIENNKSLKKLCEKIGIKYFEGKINYWEMTHPTFFGSNSVKSKNGYEEKKQLDINARTDLTYDKPNNELKKTISKIFRKYPQIELIKNTLDNNSINKNSAKPSRKIIKYNQLQLFLLFLKDTMLRKYRYYFPANIFYK